MKLINITDITEYLYCPRKVFFRLVKGIKTPPNQRMINGMLRHKVFDLFNKNEASLVSSIKEKLEEKEIRKLYDNLLLGITEEIIYQNRNLMESFALSPVDFKKSVKETINPEINIRIPSIIETINRGFLGKELWRELKPKYLTEFKIVSEELGLQGRVDRIEFSENISPVEIKTREKVYDSDKIQLAGYALLLEKEFGKPVNFGIVEILGKKQQIELNEELKNKVLEIAEKLRNLTDEQAEFPSNFEKCRNCDFRENCQ